MSREKTVKGATFRMDYASEHIARLYEVNGFETQIVHFEENEVTGLLVQVRNTKQGLGGKLKRMVGMGACATLKMSPHGNDLDISVMGGKWIDKVTVNVISWIVLWPLFFTSGIGMWKQKKLLDNLYADALEFFEK